MQPHQNPVDLDNSATSQAAAAYAPVIAGLLGSGVMNLEETAAARHQCESQESRQQSLLPVAIFLQKNNWKHLKTSRSQGGNQDGPNASGHCMMQPEFLCREVNALKSMGAVPRCKLKGFEVVKLASIDVFFFTVHLWVAMRRSSSRCSRTNSGASRATSARSRKYG